MNKSEMIKWLQNLKKDIGQYYQDLWHYEEMLDEVIGTIEISEDCVSRNYLEEQLQQIEDITAMAHIDLGEDPYDETEEITMPISTVRKIFKNAPSVAPIAEPQTEKG